MTVNGVRFVSTQKMCWSCIFPCVAGALCRSGAQSLHKPPVAAPLVL